MLEGLDGSADGSGSVIDTHGLLLSLAGLIDDELLGWSRELAAVGQSDYALELITATVVAEGLRLPEAVHAALRAARRGQPRIEMPAPERSPAMRHRFLADPTAAGYPAAVAANFPVETLRTLPGRLLRGCRLRLSWRLTPVGSAAAPVPHPVLLVETADRSGADLLAYQVTDLLGQAGVFASVEVLGPDSPVGEYHRAALDASVALGDLDPPAAGPQTTAGRTAAGTPHTDPPHTDPPRTPPRGTPVAARESAPRPSLGPVDRVIAARASAPRNRGLFEGAIRGREATGGMEADT
jgi:hypothetical protein